MTPIVRIAAAIIAIVLTLGACKDNSGPGPDAGPGRLLFTRAGNGLADIYAIDVSYGKNLQQVTTSFAIDDWASWSPDTSETVFQSDRVSAVTGTTRFQIYVMNADFSNVSQLTFNDTAKDSTGAFKDTSVSIQPTWSADGTKIAFSSTREGNSEIYAMDPNGANVVNLTNEPTAADGQPAWSPDGNRIAFATDRDGNAEIYVMNTNGTGLVNLTNNPARDLVPTWSPDGAKIAFQSDRTKDFAVWVMNADGSSPVRLTNAGPSIGAPSWSPDGTRIAYTQDGDIWVMNADGSNKIRVTSGFWADGLPRWRPIL